MGRHRPLVTGAAARRLLAGGVCAALVSVATAGCTPASVAGAGSRPPCPAVFFGVAGSGEGPAFPAPSSVPAGVTRSAVHRFGPQLALVAERLRAVAGPHLTGERGIDYPAATARHWISLTGLTGLAASEALGTRRLVAEVRRSYRNGCGRRPVLLAGYSQGAEVVIDAVNALPVRRQRSVTVALLGNPSFEPDRPGDVPRTASASGVRPTFLDGHAKQLPAGVRRRTFDGCAAGDPVCGVAPSPLGLLGRIEYVVRHLSVHTGAYLTGSWSRRAADFLWRHRVPMR